MMAQFYSVVDAARLRSEINIAKALNPHHASLYKGRKEEHLADVGPYLFAISKDSEFTDWYFENGWGDSWGVFVQSPVSYDEIYQHFRKFLLVKVEGGQELYFRFYDPRVLKIFLPTCDEKQIMEFFGPVEKFIVEGDTREDAIEYSQKSGILQQVKSSAEKVFGKQVSIVSKGPELLQPKKKWSVLDDETSNDNKQN